MRPQKILDTDLLIALAGVFRSKGYEGTSLKDLSEVSGLKKASLYHRFPGGKQEMAESVFNYFGKWVEENIFSALNDEKHSPEERLKNGLLRIRTLYDGGKENCIFNAFSMQMGLSLFEQNINEGLKEWIKTFTNLGFELQLPSDIAEEKAIQTLIEIQGSLIVAKGVKNIRIFDNTLKRIENRYLKV